MIGERFGEYFRNIKETVAGSIPFQKREQKQPFDSMFQGFVYGNQVSEGELLSNMDVSDIGQFESSLEELERSIENGTVNDRSVVFKANQLRNMLTEGLEARISKAKGENVIERWN